jgi:hypothetical protein
MRPPTPAPLRALADEVENGVRAVRALPGLVDTLERVGATLDDLARIRPALDDLAKIGPALERIATLGDVLESLLEVLRPLGTLDALVPTLQHVERSIAALEVTIGSVSETLAPLQGTAQRVGRVVDRFGNRRAPRAGTGDAATPPEATSC